MYERIYRQVECLSNHISMIVKRHSLFSGILELNILCIQYMRAYDEKQIEVLTSLISQIEPMIEPYVKKIIEFYDTDIKRVKNKCIEYNKNLFNKEYLRMYYDRINSYMAALEKYTHHKDLTALLDMEVSVEHIQSIFSMGWIAPKTA